MKKLFIISAFALLAAGCSGSFTSNQASATSSVNTTQPSSSAYTMSQVRQANNAQKCWSVISGKVYNLTTYVNRHNGGAQAILSICGKDGTAAFTSQHGGDRRPAQELATMQIGTLQ